MNRFAYICLASAVLVVAPASYAAKVTLNLTGHTGSVAPALASTFSAGQTWTAQIVYDDSVPADYGSTVQAATYSGAVSSFALGFPGASFATGGAPYINVANDYAYGPSDLSDRWSLIVDPLTGPTLGIGPPRFGIVFEERNAAPTFLSSIALFPPSLAKFQYAFLQYPGFNNVQLLLDSLTVSVAVPEPGSQALLGLSLLGLTLIRRKRV